MQGDDRPAGAQRRFAALGCILALSAALNLAGIWWGLPASNDWAPDEIFPQQVLTGLESHFAHGWYDRYPPVHFYLLSLLYAPFLVLYRANILHPAPDAMNLLFYYIGRFLSVAMAAASLVLVFKIGREILDRRAALFAALITALIVPFPYYAKTANLDVPYLFWFLWSLYFFVKIVKTQQAKFYIFFALTAALSICTKDQAYGLYILAPALIVWADRRAAAADGRPRLHRPFFRSLLRLKYVGMAASGAATFILAHNLLFNWSGFIQHVRLIVGPASQDYRMFPATAGGHLKLLGLTLNEIRFCLGWPILIICLAGLVLAIVERPKNFRLLVLALFGLSYYVFYIAVIRYNFDRFNLPIAILLSFFGGRAVAALDGFRPPWRVIARTAAGAAFVYSFSLAASVDILMVKDSRYAVERWLHAHVPQGTRIAAVGLPNYLPRLDGYAWRSIEPRLAALEGPVKPDYVVLNTRYSSLFADGSPERRFFEEFHDIGLGYRLAYRYQTPLGWLPLRTEGVRSNLALTNPEIEVYERRGR